MPGSTDLEQLLLEYVNAARLDPLGDATRYISSYTPLTSPDPAIQSAIAFFGVSGSVFLAQMSALTPTQPLAWSDTIATAARGHSQAMIDGDSQSHELPGEPNLGARLTNAGYNFSLGGENIYAFAQSMLFAHAGFMIDWGLGTDGMQSPPGHRNNIMNGTFREIGIGVLTDSDSATQLGPYVVTEDLGRALGGPAVFLLGIAYNDIDNNNFYSLGEGRAGLSITANGSNTTTTSSGGYALGVGAGIQTVTFSGGLSIPLVFTADLANGTNAKIDAIGQSTLLTSASITLVSGIDTVRGLGAIGLTLTGSGRDETFIGTSGNDTLVGGAGNDIYIVGNSGDSLVDSSGIDTVQSWIQWVLGNGLENLTLLGSAAYGVGNDLDNVITGNGANNPLLRGDAGADTIFGGGGNDWIEGETGNDAFAGVAGNDTLYGEAGDDIVLAGAGDDVVYGGSGTDFLIGETGNDLMYGGSEWDAIDGRQGSDVLYGEGGADIIFGDGYFYLFGFANDSLFGGDGDDIMMGEAGESSTSGAGDAIYGEAGNDLLDGGGGNDAIYGGDGNDIIDGDHGNDYIVGGPGAEIMLGSNALAYGGPTQGSDLFVYQSMADAGDSIYGFDTRPGENDGIDLRPLFDALGYAGMTPRALGTNLLQIVDSGGNALVQIDPDGAPGPQGFTTLLTLVGVSAATITDSYFLFQ